MRAVVDVKRAEATFPGKNGKTAYSGWGGHGYETFTINIGGGGKAKVTNNKTDDYSPFWKSRP